MHNGRSDYLFILHTHLKSHQLTLVLQSVYVGVNPHSLDYFSSYHCQRIYIA